MRPLLLGREIRRGTQILRRRYSKVPKPTWSINELNLQSKSDRPTITDDELDVLAHRCLIDVKNLSDEKRMKLKLELGNIMRCISLVCESNLPERSEEEKYDLPRGFDSKSCFLRDEEEELRAWKNRVQGESEWLLKKLDHKTVQIESETGSVKTYFSIITENGDAAKT